MNALRQRVLAQVSEERCIALLKQMIRIKSYCNTPGETDIARYMAEHMQSLGMATELQRIYDERYNAIGTLKGAGGGKSLMYNGHLDTNMAGMGWTKDPFGGEISDGCIYGIGVSNMKASDAAFVEAVNAIINSGVQLRGDVLVGLVVGELQGGVGTMHMLEQGVRADYFINGEPTDLALMTMHAGTFEAAIHVTGRTRHLSKLEEGISAIDKAVTVIAALKQLKFSGIAPGRTDHEGLMRINVGVIRGGMGKEYLEWRAAMVPDYCSIKFACRIAPGQTVASAMADIQALLDLLKVADPELETELELIGNGQKIFMPPFDVPKEHPFVQSVAGLHRAVTGKEPRIGDVAPYKYYGTDAAHLQVTGGMMGVIYGCGGKYNTMPDERVELTDLMNAARVYALTILETCL